MTDVVVVESPAKAKTINRYLGPDYQVLASYGHVRDLPPKDGSVLPDEGFQMTWSVDSRAEKRLKEIAQAVKQAKRLYLATDPDREGEAISWHIAEELKRRRVLKDVEVFRVVFNEVTKSAVQEAFAQPRELNEELINAYLARRALDYLVGFTLSPVLWRKLPGSRSAGRVQSVALRLVCERESEIETFKPQEYWSITASLEKDDGASFEARLTHLDGRKLDRFDLADQASAEAAAQAVRDCEQLRVTEIERKEVNRNPFPPFTTSTLQQEASRKLRLGATRTMRLAQQLYEGVDIGGETVGLITYMRTDGVQISQEAISAARNLIADKFGDAYLPSGPRIYRSKAKNAQEAHEAIRPTNVTRHPDSLAGRLEPDALKLYELIWKRTLASQMAGARLEQTSVDIEPLPDMPNAPQGLRLRANGQVLKFDGFLRLYQESSDDPKNGDESLKRLPTLSEAEELACREVTPDQHFTQPPPRYTEASLVKKLEELGIGRPSTYASILQVLQDRDYVRLEKRRFLPEDRGRLVTAFLSSFFERYVEYNFTADLETQLDEISDGRADWRQVLTDFWTAFHAAVDETKDLRIAQVIDCLDEDLGPHFFPVDPEKPDHDPRQCPKCGDGRLGLRLAKNGGFIGCSNYPECRFTRPLAVPGADGDQGQSAEPRELGRDPATGQSITLRKGPFGFYLQLGEPEGDAKPKRVSLPRDKTPDTLSMEEASGLLSLPREIGPHPEDGEMITAGIGRFGPYIKHGKQFCSLKNDDVLSVGLNRAVALIAEAKQRGGSGKELGQHPEDGKPVTLRSGRYGPYVKHNRLNASLPKDLNPDEVTLEQAVELLTAQAAKAKTGKKAKAAKPKSGKAKTAKTKTAKTAKAKTAKPKAKTAAKSKAKSGGAGQAAAETTAKAPE